MPLLTQVLRSFLPVLHAVRGPKREGLYSRYILISLRKDIQDLLHIQILLFLLLLYPNHVWKLLSFLSIYLNRVRKQLSLSIPPNHVRKPLLLLIHPNHVRKPLSLYRRPLLYNLKHRASHPNYVRNPLPIPIHPNHVRKPLSLYQRPLLYNLKHQASFLPTNGRLYRALIEQWSR